MKSIGFFEVLLLFISVVAFIQKEYSAATFFLVLAGYLKIGRVK